MRSLARSPWPPLAAAAGLFWLAAVGCQGAAPPAAASKETPDAPKHDRPALAAKALDRGDEADRKALVQSINAFALDLYGRVGQADKNANVFLSPYSVATALGMTYPGAAGDTAQEMEKTLHFTLPAAKLQAAFADLDAGPASTLGGKPTRFHYRLGLVVAEKDGAVKIAKVVPGTPAEKAGLQPGQQVVAIDDRPIAGGVDYAHALDLAGPTIKVEVRDGDKAKAVDVALANPPPLPQYQLAVANALWGQKGVAFKPEFVKAAQVAFQARVEEVDFVKKPDEAVKAVNDWVADKTNKQVKELLTSSAVSPNTRLVLTNAVTFTGRWEQPFEPRATQPGAFTTPEARVRVPMMNQTGDFRYAKGGGFEVLEMPYDDGEVVMDVFLPEKADGLAALEKELTADNLAAWLPKLREGRVKVALPKFKFAAATDLKKVLAETMPTAFSPKADFSNMTVDKTELYLSAVLHRAEVEVDEAGTKASAGTAVVVTAKSVGNVSFVADHPFAFLIRDTRTGAILFAGRVTNPKS